MNTTSLIASALPNIVDEGARANTIMQALRQLTSVQTTAGVAAFMSNSNSTAPAPAPNTSFDYVTATMSDLDALQTEWDVLRAQLHERPHDPDGWNRLVRLAEGAGDTTQIRETYDGLLAVYPGTVRASAIATLCRLLPLTDAPPSQATAQVAYLKHFTTPELFKRFLLANPHVELWLFYLAHVRRTNNAHDRRDDVRKAFEYALRHIGQDKDAGEIWAQYIQFLRAAEVCAVLFVHISMWVSGFRRVWPLRTCSTRVRKARSAFNPPYHLARPGRPIPASCVINVCA
jgi:hypothetical protein